MADAPSAKFSFSGPEAAVTAASCVALPVIQNTGRSLVGIQWEALSRPQDKANFGDELRCSGADSGHAEVNLIASICCKRQAYSNADLET